MKHPLYKKFIIIYLCFAIITILLIATLGTALNRRYRRSLIEEQLYNAANYYVNTYTTDLITQKNGLSDLLSVPDAIEESRNSSIWILDKQFNVLYPDEEITVNDFEPEHSDSHHGFVSTLGGYYKDEMLCAYAPITMNFTIAGYVIIAYPMSEVTIQVNQATNVLYIISGGIFIMSLLLFLFIHILILKPIRQITKASQEYAAGNLTYTYKYKSNDELGVLSETQKYMASALAQTAEDQRKFITNVSHDFRSPLTSIHGYLEAILDGTIPPELYEKYIGIVKNETDRLTSLTQNILDLNTLGQNGALLDYSDFDIHHEIKKILATFEGRCSDKRISFELTFSSHEFMVHADLGRIQQVLYNLIDNAIKFSNPGSTIFIETKESRSKAYISIKDQGVGIAPENQKKIWERFYKTDPSRGRDKKGSGLGLSITKDIIQAHGETIDVISTPDVGTEFIFTLQPADEQ